MACKESSPRDSPVDSREDMDFYLHIDVVILLSYEVRGTVVDHHCSFKNKN
jgi:hypothetical protein